MAEAAARSATYRMGMTVYAAPLDDIRFALELAGLGALTELEHFAEIDVDAVDGVLDEFGRLMADVWAPTNRIGDQTGSFVRGDEVVVPAEFHGAFAAFVSGGWGSVPFDAAYGGGGFPWVVGIAQQEMLDSANLALSLAPLLTHGAIDAIGHHGTEEQREVYMTRMIAGTWTGTMNLTEPQAGSDVGALRTRAIAQPDGTYRITGQKIFITWGEHPLTENIVHLVLARTPDAPAGTKGISCFIVPKFLVNDDGSLGERNDVRVVSVEHKLGITASPTCVLAFGDHSDGAIGYRIGEECAGMRVMFTMMNNARLAVGVQGLGLAERSLQAAVAYANERRQGYAPGAPRNEPSLIVEHPDVRRNLLTMRSITEAMRNLSYYTAQHVDLARFAHTAEQRAEAQEILELMIPLSKSWCTDEGERVTSIGVQVHGGMGYIEETGVAQLYRDAKITQIYEGTNGIQAMDLVGRKMPMRAGAVFTDHIARMRATVGELAAAGADLGGIAAAVGAAVDAAESVGLGLLRADAAEVLAVATPFQRLLALTTAGWLMGRQALAAAQGAGRGSSDLLAQKLVTARFFATNILAEVHGLVGPASTGAAELRAARFG